MSDLALEDDYRLEIARGFIEEGFTPLPCSDRKIPMTFNRTEKGWLWKEYKTRGLHDGELEALAEKFPGSNWGYIVKRGQVIVDADSEECVDWCKANLPHAHRRVKTRRGYHFWYTQGQVPISKKMAGDDIDVLPEGNFVVMPGSVHHTGHVYTQEVDEFIDETWWAQPKLESKHVSALIDYIAAQKEKKRKESGEGAIGTGNRNNALTEEAGRIFSRLEYDTGLVELIEFNKKNCDPPLSRSEVETIAGSIWRNELAQRKANDEKYATPGNLQESALETAPVDDWDARPVVYLDEANLARRDFVYSNCYIRQFVSMMVAEPGKGKSIKAICEAVAMASGKPLLGVETQRRRVWIYNLEDPMQEMQRRLLAVMKHYGVSFSEIEGHLFMNSGRDDPLKLGYMHRGDAKVSEMADRMLHVIQKRQIDAVILDPFVSAHDMPENDNGAVDAVVKALNIVADRGNCAIQLIHHTRKGNGNTPGVEDSRGASSLIGAVRHARRLAGMTKEEGASAGIDANQVWRYQREYASKDNLAPPNLENSWLHMVTVKLDNGDEVGVLEPWQWPDAFEDVPTWMIRICQEAIAQGEYRADSRSPEWVGYVIAAQLDWDAEDEQRKGFLKTIIDEWVKNGVLRLEERPDKKRRNRKFVVVGDWFRQGFDE